MAWKRVRLLELAISDASTASLLDVVPADVSNFLKDPVGHHVIESALEHGLPHQRLRILDELK